MNIAEFLALGQKYPVLDVRSPGEYRHAHMPGAHSLPLFTDEERKVVGTTYKQQGRQPAIKIGLDYFGPKMRRMVEEVEQIAAAHTYASEDARNTVLVHCWRGGMRSGAVTWLLGLYGFKVYTLAGGYKAFRNHMLATFAMPRTLHILGGYTGAGKTEVLQQLARTQQVIDLEALAHHKGSAFGRLGEQPTQEMFENNLGMALLHTQPEKPLWLEDESRRIGDLNLPQEFWNHMRTAPVYFLDIPFEARLKHLVATYGKYKHEDLVSGIMRIRKRLGGLNARNAINHLLEGDVPACFDILLRYYDKLYGFGLENREDARVIVVKCNEADTANNIASEINVL